LGWWALVVILSRQSPQTPRPPQAVGMKTRLRASAWKSDSPGWALMVLAPLLIETL